MTVYQFLPSQIPVTIVAGAPGSGKTTYVCKHMRHGDLIVDVDMLYQALSGLTWYDKPLNLLPFVCEARDSVIARLARESNVGRAWIVTGEADVKKLRDLKHALRAERLIMLDVSPSTCRKRILQDERRQGKAKLYEDMIAKWFTKFDATKERHASG